MPNPWDDYHQIVVETYEAKKSGKATKVHVRPVPNEVFSVDIDVECSRSIRKDFPIGTRFRIYAKQTSREGGKPFLYSSYKWPVTVVGEGQ